MILFYYVKNLQIIIIGELFQIKLKQSKYIISFIMVLIEKIHKNNLKISHNFNQLKTHFSICHACRMKNKTRKPVKLCFK